MRRLAFPLALLLALLPAAAAAQKAVPPELIYQPGQLKPVDSVLAVKVGDKAPDFDLPATDGSRARLADYLGKKNLVISFVPAAWTPVCSGQWPGYNLAKEIFEKHDAALLGVTCDNLPSLNAWIVEMGGVWFKAASDFWPHGGLSARLGVLRPEGVSERALFVIDKAGVIRFIDVHDINARPDLGQLAKALADLK
ncbi:Putative peroxiredoxin [Fundidesulfovibrio magnetotacticus]|uniref:Peroxiredoxin n=1 Tax=Fundidesulfovibrio magnetotacticus TaxID=2730080 RepID=A0A6V8LT34_9BACT|nr:redoxin domain-containing protein [Fundidesulfovibrio magnetotacticus]GFK93478.1 Putative peroxiredoxin [Fundidesulfovibrio magnetotacticus]